MLKPKNDATRSTCGNAMLLFMCRQFREAVKFLGTKGRQNEAPGKTIGLQDEGTCVEEIWIPILKTSSLSNFAQPVIENSYADFTDRR